MQKVTLKSLKYNAVFVDNDVDKDLQFKEGGDDDDGDDADDDGNNN